MSAVLRCVERTPSQAAAAITDAACACRVVATKPWFEVAIEVEVPLRALPTMAIAGHSVDWVLVLTDSVDPDTPHEVPVVVAPVVAATVLQGEGRS